MKRETIERKIADRFQSWANRGGDPVLYAKRFLDGKISEACDDCKGSGRKPCPVDTDGDGNCGFCAHGRPHPCMHDDAPTYWEALAVGVEAIDHRDYLWAVEGAP